MLLLKQILGYDGVIKLLSAQNSFFLLEVHLQSDDIQDEIFNFNFFDDECFC